jgi:hypothetical protein
MMEQDKCPVCKGPAKFFKGDGDSQWCETTVRPGGIVLSPERFDRVWEYCRDYSVDYSDMKRLMFNELFGEQG